jgi:hypothetical protein
MSRKPVAKDKLYYISELLSIFKSDLGHICDVSETALRKWSYNPNNVSEELRTKIEETFMLLDYCHVQIRRVECDPVYSKIFELSDFDWCITVDASRYLINGNVNMGRFLRRELMARASSLHSLPAAKYKSLRLNGMVCRIAFDERLEMPEGQFSWDESLSKKGR